MVTGLWLGYRNLSHPRGRLSVACGCLSTDTLQAPQVQTLDFPLTPDSQAPSSSSS